MKNYVVVINGIPHTVQLSEEDVAALGDAAQPVQAKQVKPANKQRAPRNKER